MTFFSTAAEVDEVLTSSAVQNFQKVIRPLREAIEFIERQAPARYLVPTVPHVVLSEATVLGLFDALWRLDRETAPQAARQIGETAGLRFAELFWTWLVAVNRMPANTDALLRVWTQIESGANWGQFRYTRRDSEIVVHVEGSFLNRDSNAPHRYCDFMAGYIFGFLWISLKELHYRLIGQRGGSTDEASIARGSIERKCAGDQCSLEIPLGTEPLWDAVEELLKARNFARTEPGYVDLQIVSLRKALESSLQIAFGLRESDRFEHAVRAAKEALKPNRVWVEILKNAEETHSRLSEPLHRRRDAATGDERVQDLTRDVERFLRLASYMPLEEKDREKVREGIHDRQTQKRVSEPPRETG